MNMDIDKDTKSSLMLYAGIIGSILAQFVPVSAIQGLGALGILAILFITGHLRRRSKADSMIHSHATYLGRTIWIWSFILLISLVVAGYHASTQYSLSEFTEITRALAAHDIDDPAVREFIKIGLYAALPGVIYLVMRLARGIAAIARGNGIQNPRRLL